MMLTVCSAPSVRFCLVLKTIVVYRGQPLSHLFRILSICLMGFFYIFPITLNICIYYVYMHFQLVLYVFWYNKQLISVNETRFHLLYVSHVLLDNVKSILPRCARPNSALIQVLNTKSMKEKHLCFQLNNIK